jgi:hypothetical protein
MYQFYVGCDFGYQNDYTAITLLERTVTRKRDLLDNFIVEYAVRHLERTRETEYPVVIQRLVEMFHHSNLKNDGALIVDATGLGLPLIQELKRQKLPVTGITITAGHDVTVTSSASNMFNVPKNHLVSALVLLFQSGKIKISSELKLAKVLQEELQSFGYKINKKTTTTTYEAMTESVHDDLVISLALAVWFANRNDNNATPKGYREYSATEKEYDPLYWGL